MSDAPTAEVNAIARHITDGTTIDREFYYDEDTNPLQKAYLNVAMLGNACLFLEEASLCVEDLDNFGQAGFRHVVRLVADQLRATAGSIDTTNSEICAALEQARAARR